MAWFGPVAAPIAFLSGAAALLFETLWFHAASLVFGSGVWASSLVLSSFMAGLAIGSFAAAHLGTRVAHPFRAYAGLELAIALGGVALSIGLPGLSQRIAPLLAPLRDSPLTLNALRFGLAFVLMTIPATAMGATFPLFVRALFHGRARFERVLGSVYGVNTLGAVAGSVSGAAFLLERLGVAGTAYVAGGMNLSAAALALALSRSYPAAPGTSLGPRRGPVSTRVLRLLAAAFLSGAAFLALEVVWFRFLSLFIYQTRLVFALMLAVVLAGIALGGLLGSRIAALAARPGGWLPGLMLATGAATLASYRGFTLWFDPSRMYGGPETIPPLAAVLALPTALLSGVLFVALGAAAQRELAEPARATGYVSLANTVGAACGSLLGGFVVLPALGIEKGLVALALSYAVAAWFAALRDARSGVRSSRFAMAGLALALAGLTLSFPFGQLRTRFLVYPTLLFPDSQSEIAAVRESRLSTLMYVRTSRFGQPYHYQLFTDGLSMSGTNVYSKRYMKSFVYLPAALHPELKSALLISFGLGSTAKALTDLPDLERIDVVDISSDILELGALVFGPGETYPLRDPRVRTFVEDGRFFLATAPERYDLITGEPPPPKLPGVVNLYTREYFELVRQRLNEGGFATYWIPAHNLAEGDTRAILRAFCDAFDDCTLWSGAGLDWIVMGTRNAAPAAGEGVRRLWREPASSAELARLGFETPAQLGATFLAGSETLHRITQDTEPVTDAFPMRISSERILPKQAFQMPMYRKLMDPDAASREFTKSGFIRKHWPLDQRDATQFAFRLQRTVTRALLSTGEALRDPRELYAVLAETRLRALPLWLLGSDAFEEKIVASLEEPEASGPIALYMRGVSALAARQYGDAARLLEAAYRGAGARRGAGALELSVLAACLAGDIAHASQLAGEVIELDPAARANDARWAFLGRTFGLTDPRAKAAATGG